MATSEKKTGARKKPTRGAAGGTSGGFSAEEKDALRERAQEVRAAARAGAADGERDLLAKIEQLPDADRRLAERVHALIMASGPTLSPRTWYGMPAYARDGKVVCFFQAASKFKVRYATLGFSDAARLDDGELWPTSYALIKLTPAVEARISALVKQAIG